MKFETGNAIADIDQRSSGICLDHAAAFLDRLEDHHSLTIRHRFVFARDEIIERMVAVLVLVKRRRLRSQHFLNARRNCLAFFAHPLDRFGHADCIPRLENTDLPAKTPLDRVVDLDNGICDFGNSISGVSANSRGRFPKEFANAIITPNEILYARLRILDLLCGINRSKLSLNLRFVFEGREIEFEDHALAFGILRFLVKSAFRFIAEQLFL